MAKFRKKPVIIEAVQLPPSGRPTNTEAAAVVDFLGPNGRWHDIGIGHIEIETLEGTMTASPGDWIIKGVKGEFYPCKPDVFELTYEPVD